MYEIERGQQNPTYRVLQAIADLHGIKLSKVFALAEKKYEQRRR
jgi:DNA-binding XRE family transcriptional regulator